MLMTAAPRPFRAEVARAPNNALVSRNGPRRLTLSACSSSSHSVSASIASGVGPKTDALFNQHVEAPEVGGYLQCDRVNIFLPPNVGDDPVPTRLSGDLLDRRGIAGDEGDMGTARNKVSN